jgi:hypothetical protein
VKIINKIKFIILVILLLLSLCGVFFLGEFFYQDHKECITQATFEGDLIEGGAVVTATLDDIPDDIKELIECGIFTEEEALVKCSSNGNREQRMVIRKPMIRLVGDDKQPVAQIFPEKFSEEDLVFDFNNSQEVEKAESGTTATVATSDDMSWLDNL